MAIFKRSIWEKEIRNALFSKAKVLKLMRNDFFTGEEDRTAQGFKQSDTLAGAFYGGETVYFPKRGALNVNDYVQSSGVTIQTITTEDTAVNIDKHKEITFAITDIQKVQSNSDLRTGYTEDVGEKLKAAIENEFFTAINDEAGIDTLNVTSADPKYQEVLAIQSELDNSFVPDSDRYIIATPELDAYLRQIKNGTIGASVYVDADPESVKTGVIGFLAGFQIIKSTNLPSGIQGIALHKNAAGLAYNWGVRVETWRDGQYKRDIVSADARFGVGLLETDFIRKIVLV